MKIVTLPSNNGQFDAYTLVPFLLLNDHSIILVRNPKKEVMQILKQIIRSGSVHFKEPGSASAGISKPIALSVTIWILVDVTGYLPSLTQPNKNRAAGSA